MKWICAVIACGRPENEPHVDGCPYANPAPVGDDGADGGRG